MFSKPLLRRVLTWGVIQNSGPPQITIPSRFPQKTKEEPALDTTPKFNMEPENQSLEKGIPIGKHHFQVNQP